MRNLTGDYISETIQGPFRIIQKCEVKTAYSLWRMKSE